MNRWVLVACWWGLSAAAETSARRVSKFELVAYPVQAQINGKFSQHYGSALSLLWRPSPVFATHLTGHYNWHSSDSSFTDELSAGPRTGPRSGTSLLWSWGALAGFEMEPLEGVVSAGERWSARLSIVLNGGLGVGGTRIQLLGAGPLGPALYGDTGLRLLGALGGGIKVELGEWFDVRLELRDVFFSGRLDRVNGCTLNELLGYTVSDYPVGQASAECANGQPMTQLAALLAVERLRATSSDVIHVVGLYVGLGLNSP